MHTTMQQRVEDLAALRERTVLATADFYAKLGRPAPAEGPNYKAVAKGNAWHIVEVKTGKTRCFCFSYKAALRFVDALEAAATRKLVGRQ
ncbi:hypothetical protein GPJ81_14150 [Pseudomonas alkylphenolica]|uniref:Uncharacterized protein n=1 Tax=Pseudomonas alkylphenolica TaxID=237609 RepID=A0A6I6HHM3_9PSED|nr:hypothetical protein [Pseudomonas alkylphenolica]QGW77777.1 hypothetical protein GPJ81_14150 [Pseudomonas alkylphenolica]